MPALLISTGHEPGKGSARSIAAIDLYARLDGCRSLFTSLGGHSHAAGFAIRAADIAQLRRDTAADLRRNPFAVICGTSAGASSSGVQGVGIFLNWELDLWGRIRAGQAAAAIGAFTGTTGQGAGLAYTLNTGGVSGITTGGVAAFKR